MSNYATFNPVNATPQVSGSWAYSNGNRTATITGEGTAFGTISVSSGKFYWEVDDGTQIIGVALNLDDYECTWYKANSAQYTNVTISAGSYVPAIAGSSGPSRLGIGISKLGTVSSVSANLWNMAEAGNYIYWSNDGILYKSNETNGSGGATFANVSASTINFGQTDFTYTPPTGYNKLSTANITAPAVANSSNYFYPVVYEGNGSGQRVGNFLPFTSSYAVTSSFLLNMADTQYLENTFSGAGTGAGKTWTYSVWVKRGILSTGYGQTLFHWSTGGTNGSIAFQGPSGSAGGQNNNLYLWVDNGTYYFRTTRLYKDVSQWYNFVIAVDTTQASSTDRVKMYVNGTEITNWNEYDTLPLNHDTSCGQAKTHWIGYDGANDETPMDGYMAQNVFIDGLQLTASSFGQTDTSTNRWVPKDVSGLTFGTNGFYLNQGTDGIMGRDASVTSGSAISETYKSTYVDSTAQTTFTKTGAALGSADSNRYVIVGVMTVNNDSTTVSSVSVGGVSATKMASASGGASGYTSISEFWKANVPSGTTGDISVVFSGATDRAGFDWWTCIGDVQAQFVNKTEVTGTGGVNTYTANQQCPDNGFVTAIIAAQCDSGDPSFTWAGTGIAEDSETGWDSFDGGFSAASGTYTTGGVNTITATNSNGNAHYSAFLVVGWVPAVTNLNSFNPINFYGNNQNQVYDSPSRNCATLDFNSVSTSDATLAYGNLKYTYVADGFADLTMPELTSGKWYVEMLTDTNHIGLGILRGTNYPSADRSANLNATGIIYYNPYSGTIMVNGSGTTYGSGLTAGDVLGMALDLDNGTVFFSKNGTWQNSGNPATGANPAVSNIQGNQTIIMGYGASGAATLNTGQWRYFDGATLSFNSDADGYFRYTPPSGFKAINQNNRTAGSGIVTGWSWIKNRDTTEDHITANVISGIYKNLDVNNNLVETTDVESMQKFLEQGVQIGNQAAINTDGESMVAYNWGTTASASTVSGGMVVTTGGATSNITRSLNADSGISLIGYTGTGAYSTIQHGLSATPQCFFIRQTNAPCAWKVWHHSYVDPLQSYMVLNNNGKEEDFNDNRMWGGAPATSTTIGVGDHIFVNDSGDTYRGFIFAPVEGYSSFGKFSTNNSADGPFVYTGFRPAWVLLKKMNATGSWYLWDGARMTFNPAGYGGSDNGYPLQVSGSPNQSESGVGSGGLVDLCASGFKIRNTWGDINASSNTTLYIAFAEFPFGGSGVSQTRAK